MAIDYDVPCTPHLVFILPPGCGGLVEDLQHCRAVHMRMWNEPDTMYRSRECEFES